MGRNDRPDPTRFFLGVEGGGTRTVAILADAQECEVQRLEGGPANLKLLSDEELVKRLGTFSRLRHPPAAVCVGLAGLRSETDRLRVLHAAQAVWPGVPCHACADLETALAATAARPGLPRVLVLSGTGSCCYGRHPDGRTAKLGGWGHLLGDQGSAYDIALRALQAVAHYSDRDGAWPPLGQRFLQSLHLNLPDDLIAWAQAADKKDLAALALEVFAAADRHDKIALEILQGAAHTLAQDAAQCAQHLARPGAKVQFIFAGSVLLKQPRFASRVARALRALWPTAVITRLERESAWGAVRLAQDEFNRLSVSGAQPSASSQAPSPAAPAPEVSSPCFIPNSTALSPTERRNPRSLRLDQLPLPQAIRVMLTEEAKVPSVLLGETINIARGIELIVRAFNQGGRLIYVGAGTSGRIGALDASECPPTFRLPAGQVQAIMAGGQRALWDSIEGAEDDAVAGAEAVRSRGLTKKDVVVGIAASGRTPFVWGALHAARRCGATTILLCFNPYLDLPEEHRPDLVLAPSLGPEVLTGSTRLKAGTATKLLLNLFTTLAMVRLGKVESNLMVDLNPSNQKLRQRAIRIVGDLTGASPSTAARTLETCGWVVKRALDRLRSKSARHPHP